MKPTVFERRLFNSKETAAYIGTSLRLLWTLQNSGEIPSIRIGRKVLFDRVDLDAWIESRKSVRR